MCSRTRSPPNLGPFVLLPMRPCDTFPGVDTPDGDLSVPLKYLQVVLLKSQSPGAVAFVVLLTGAFETRGF